MNNKINVKQLIISIIIPLLVGTVSGLLSMNSMQQYEFIQKPPLSPPAIVFPIVWTILYILMGISSYLIYSCNCTDRNKALTVYAIQLAVNFIWPLIFFNAGAYLIAFVWLVLLWLLVLYMILLFYPINKAAALLQIPYLVWLTFAGYLNYSVYMLNR